MKQMLLCVIRDPFSIRAMFVHYPFNGCSISVFLKTVDYATKRERVFLCITFIYHTCVCSSWYSRIPATTVTSMTYVD